MNEREIFIGALQLEPSDRAAYLEKECGGNPEIQGRVAALMQAFGQAGSFLEQPADGCVATLDPTHAEKPGAQIGHYKLLEQIGEGGMGVVYVAEQMQPVRRRVALKIIKPGMDTKQVIARFEAERQALGMMDHPNIAKILDAGTTGEQEVRDQKSEVRKVQPTPALTSDLRPLTSSVGRPYFVMELVRGLPITEYCDKARLGPRQRLELFTDVCRAVQHAHQKGVIHRDLKPSNVMITVHDGRPMPKVIDFGVAKAVGQQLTERTVYTALTQLVGTPLYMSPEQADLSSQDVDTRSDVYSLGVLLYELLTGQTPFDKERLKNANFDEMRRIIREEEPETVSARIARTQRDERGARSSERGITDEQLAPHSALRAPRFSELDWIVMKALEKDRTRRYESASAFAADIQRYLSDEPVLACPPTTMYRFQKFARKHKPALFATAAVALCLVLGTTVSAWQAVRATTAEAQANANEQKATTERDEAQKQRDEVRALNEKLQATQSQLQRTLYAAHIILAQRAWDAGNVRRVNDFLEQYRPKSGETDLRGFEWHYLHRLCHSELLTLKGHTGHVYSVAYSPDGKRLASTSGDDKTVKVWDAQTGQELLTLKAGGAKSVAFSPDSKRLASDVGDDVKVWDAQTGEELLAFKGRSETVAYSPDGKRLASGGGTLDARNKNYVAGEVKVRDAQTGQELLTFKASGEYVSSVAYSPDGKRLASASEDGQVQVWDANTGHELLTLKGGSRAGFMTVAYSPDGKRLLSPTGGGIRVWDAQSGQEVPTLTVSAFGVDSVTFSPDGKRMAGSDRDMVKVWDAQTLRVIRTFKGGGERVVFSPDGQCLAGCAGNIVKVWDAQRDQENRTLQGTRGWGIGFSSDLKRLATASDDSTVTVWDAQSGKPTLTFKGHTVPALTVAFSPDGKRAASGGGGQKTPGGYTVTSGDRAELKVWNTESGQELFSLQGHIREVVRVTFSPDGKCMASASADGMVKVWDAQIGQELQTLKGPRGGGPFVAMAFSPDGKRLASAGSGGVKVWDAQTGQELHSFKADGYAVAFSPDGKRLASAGKLWDTQTGQELLSFNGETGSITSVVFSPDGNRVANADRSEMKLWDVRTGQELLSLRGGGREAAFSPDGNRLANGAGGGVKIYDATPLPEKP